MLNKISTLTDYQELLSNYAPIKIYSNDYIQTEVPVLISKNRLFECHTSNNLFLFVKKEIGYRAYYYIGNLEEVLDFSTIDNLVVEILYRGIKFYPQKEIDYFSKCGFTINLIRDQYCAVYKDLTKGKSVEGIFVEEANSLDEVKDACELFNNSFDVLSGDYISKDKYQELLTNNQILIAKNMEGNFLGALHQTLEKGVAWISHVAVLPEARGKHVGQALLNSFVENNHITEKQRYMFWVQQQNIAAVSMYQKKGFKYLNKSTISLIKK